MQAEGRVPASRIEMFQLIETLLWDGSYRLLPLHLRRLQASAEHFRFACRLEDIVARLTANERCLQNGVQYKVRLLVDRTGTISLDSALIEPRHWSGQITISPIATSSRDDWLLHKTTRRELYDRAHAEAQRQGLADIIFANERDEITEGAISNVFIRRGGRLYTPPVACGLLLGVYRRHLLDSHRDAVEKVLCIRGLEMADEIYICNAVRGLQPVSLVESAMPRR